MKNKLKSSKKDKGKKKKTKLYKDIMTQIESQTRYLFLSKEVRKYITIKYTLSTKLPFLYNDSSFGHIQTRYLMY